MKSLDIRSESAVKLLSEFLDMDQPYVEGEPHPNAEHFAHELCSYLRSPFRDLYVYDKMVQYHEPEDHPIRTRGGDIEIVPRLPSPSRHNGSLPRRPGGNHEGNLRRRSRGASREGRRKRSRRSRSYDRPKGQQSRGSSGDEGTSRRDKSGSQTLASSPEPPSPSQVQATKGKGKAVDLGTVANRLGPSMSGSETERATIDKSTVKTRAPEFPNVEHTVIGGSIRGNRDRVPKVLSLRQSVRAHLSLQKTEPLKVSRLPDEYENSNSGPSTRHGHPSLLERISGMEETLHDKPSVAVARAGSSASSDPSRPPRPGAIPPQRPARTSSNINHTGEGTINIDNQRRDPILNATHENDLTAPADHPDRKPRVDTDDVLERTRVRLAKMKNMMVAGIPPTAPTPPPIPPDLPTPAEPEEATPPAPVIASLRNKLLEKLESERKRAIGAASGEPEVEPVAGSVSEGSLKAELRARNRLRSRLAVTKGDCHVDTLEP